LDELLRYNGDMLWPIGQPAWTRPHYRANTV
jgi:hypothetical protein